MYLSVQVAHAVVVAHVLAVLFQMLNGRICKMSANSVDYAKMFGTVYDVDIVMARCACVSCNSCTCACSCRNIPEGTELIEW